MQHAPTNERVHSDPIIDLVELRFSALGIGPRIQVVIGSFA